MASRATQVVAVERDAVLADTLRHNAAGLKADNLEAVCDDCRHFVQEMRRTRQTFLMWYLSTLLAEGRMENGCSLFADCEPDVVSMLPQIRSRFAACFIVKASPMPRHKRHNRGSGNPKAAIVLATPTGVQGTVDAGTFDSEQSGETMIEAVTVHGRTASTFAFTRRIEAAAASPATSPP